MWASHFFAGESEKTAIEDGTASSSPGAVANTLEMVLNASSISPQLIGAEAESVLAQTDAVLILASTVVIDMACHPSGDD